MGALHAIERGYRIRGVVQGVGYRWWTRRVANELGLRGSVRNCPDGSVEVRVGGDADVVDAFVGRLREGPVSARVSAVEAFPVSGPLPSPFEIGRWP